MNTVLEVRERRFVSYLQILEVRDRIFVPDVHCIRGEREDVCTVCTKYWRLERGGLYRTYIVLEVRERSFVPYVHCIRDYREFLCTACTMYSQRLTKSLIEKYNFVRR